MTTACIDETTPIIGYEVFNSIAPLTIEKTFTYKGGDIELYIHDKKTYTWYSCVVYTGGIIFGASAVLAIALLYNKDSLEQIKK